MTTLLQDIRYGLRMLRKTPGFTAVALLTLAIGIGANVAIFSVVNSVLLRHLPFREPGRLVMVWQSYGIAGLEQVGASAAEYFDYRDRNQAFQSFAGYADASATFADGGEPERLEGARVTANLFDSLGVAPMLGRAFTAEEDRTGWPKVVALSYSLWQRKYHGDRDILGRAVLLDRTPHTVVAVMPPSFEFPVAGTWSGGFSERAEFWVPMAYSAREIQGRAASLDTRMVARLKPGFTLTQARADMERITRDLTREYSNIYGGNVRLTAVVSPLDDNVVARVRPLLLVLLGAVGFVLLIACANVANLLLARSTARQREIAIRSAIGATAGRLARQLLTEAAVLGIAGGAVGLVLTAWLVRAFVAVAPAHLPRLGQVQMDAGVLLFTLALSLLTGIFFGLIPALTVRRLDLNQALKETGRQAGAGRERYRFRNALIVLETACALLLLVGAGLLINSFVRVLRVQPGFDSSNVLITRTAFDATRYPQAEQRVAAQAEILRRLRDLPGVQAVGLSTHLPLADDRTIGFAVEGHPDEGHVANNALIGGDYFRTLGIPMLQGRAFDDHDTPDTPPVAVVNETFARQYWPAGDAMGKHFRWGTRPFTIVGIAGDVKLSGLDAQAPPTIYMSTFQVKSGVSFRAAFVVRGNADPALLAHGVRQEIWAVDKNLPVYDVQPMRQVVAASLAQRRFAVLLLGAFAGVALLLAAIGLYGVLAYSVSQRTHEMGLRVALGAQPRDVVRTVVGQGLRMTAIGLAAGLVASFAVTRVIAQFLFEVGALDPLTLGAVSTTLLLVALLAAYLPARRATKVDPMVALRYE